MSMGVKLLGGFSRGLGRLPLPVLQAMGRALGRLGFGLYASRRRVTVDNIQRSFPDQDPAWVRSLARASFEQVGQLAMECMRLARLDSRDIMARVRVHGRENFQAAKDQGRGVLLLSLHLGCWEWMVPGFALGVEPFCAVYKPLKWQPADRLLYGWRALGGNILLDRAGSLEALLKHLGQNGTVLILLDQGADWYEGVWVKFFGRDACTAKGMARLVAATGAAVVPMYLARAQGGMFDLHLEPAVPPANTGSKLQDEWQNTQNYTRALEEIIRRHPEQWFWQHRRWKFINHCPWPREES